MWMIDHCDDHHASDVPSPSGMGGWVGGWTLSLAGALSSEDIDAPAQPYENGAGCGGRGAYPAGPCIGASSG